MPSAKRSPRASGFGHDWLRLLRLKFVLDDSVASAATQQPSQTTLLERHKLPLFGR